MPGIFDYRLKIYCCDYMRNIYPWRQPRLFTPYWRFYWNATPGGVLLVQNQVLKLNPDVFTIIPGNMLFSTVAEQPFEQFFIHFNLHDQLKIDPLALIQIPVDEATLDDIHRAIACMEDPSRIVLYNLLTFRILSSALLRLPEVKFQLPPPLDPRITETMERINRDLSCHYTNEDLAQVLRMSRNAFVRLFSQEAGEPPQIYARRKRMELACELLHYSDLSIEEVAEQCGFADRYHFSKVFQRTQRATPVAFRKIRALRDLPRQ